VTAWPVLDLSQEESPLSGRILRLKNSFSWSRTVRSDDFDFVILS